ncbi:ABC transporter permease [Kineococcus arenarius]|uniref:ABC transporter permease n=1 Tax=unclassified Kineococcus TaxID=2621656 RepID=UPI003D7E1EAC
MRFLVQAATRFTLAVLTLLAVSLLVFGALRLLPGSYAELVLGPLASPQAKADAAARLGLDQGVAAQYLHWLAALLRGDLGTSFATGSPVAEEFARRFPVTLAVAVGAAAITLVAGVPLGVLTAVREAAAGRNRSGWRLLAAVGASVPEFVLAVLVVHVVSSTGIGPRIGGFEPLEAGPGPFAASLLWPVLVLAVPCAALTARTTRDAVAGVLVEPHVAACVARGEAPGAVLRHHVLRNATAPVLTLTATVVATLLGGTVIVETVFDVPGLGSYLVTALGRRDYAVVQAGVLLAAVVFVLAGALADVVAGAVDPRLRLRGSAA